MIEVNKDTVIGDIIDQAPQAFVMFQAIGMHCMGCALASGETVEQACYVHEVDPDLFLEKLKEYLATV